MIEIKPFEGKTKLSGRERFAVWSDETPILMMEFFDNDYHFYGTNSFALKDILDICVNFHSNLANVEKINNETNLALSVYSSNLNAIEQWTTRLNFSDFVSWTEQLEIDNKEPLFYDILSNSRASINPEKIDKDIDHYNIKYLTNYATVETSICKIWSDIKSANNVESNPKSRSGFASEFAFSKPKLYFELLHIFTPIQHRSSVADNQKELSYFVFDMVRSKNYQTLHDYSIKNID